MNNSPLVVPSGSTQSRWRPVRTRLALQRTWIWRVTAVFLIRVTTLLPEHGKSCTTVVMTQISGLPPTTKLNLLAHQKSKSSNHSVSLSISFSAFDSTSSTLFGYFPQYIRYNLPNRHRRNRRSPHSHCRRVHRFFFRPTHRSNRSLRYLYSQVLLSYFIYKFLAMLIPVHSFLSFLFSTDAYIR